MICSTTGHRNQELQEVTISFGSMNLKNMEKILLQPLTGFIHKISPQIFVKEMLNSKETILNKFLLFTKDLMLKKFPKAVSPKNN